MTVLSRVPWSVYPCDTRTQELRQVDYSGLEAIQSFKARPCLKKQTKKMELETQLSTKAALPEDQVSIPGVHMRAHNQQ